MTWKLPDNPFVGLRPFEAHESLLFFGRNQQIAELLNLLHESRFLAVVGSSGCGKSSLIRAGLIPRLHAGFLVEDRDVWHVAKMKPGDAPLQSFARALLSLQRRSVTEPEAERFVKEIGELGLPAVLGELEGCFQGGDSSLLLLVDQFEELFRFAGTTGLDATGDAGAELVSHLLGLVEQTTHPIYVVLTMRSDFIGDCDAFLGLPEAMNGSQYLVPRLTRGQRREAIEGPVSLYGRSVAARLTSRLLNETSERRDDLPVLQHTLMRTWDLAGRAEAKELDLPHYEDAGTIRGALSQDAEAALASMSEHERMLTKRLFQSLTEKDAGNRRVRKPAKLEAVSRRTRAEPDELWGIVQRFRTPDRSFLVVSSEDLNANPLIDISHESLIRQWDRLKNWVDEEAESVRTYRRLAETAVLHGEGRAGLYRDPDLQVALDWRAEEEPDPVWGKRHHPAFEAAMEFLTASERAHEDELAAEIARRRRRTRWGQIAAVGLSVIAAVAVSVAQHFRRLNTELEMQSAENTRLVARINDLTRPTGRSLTQVVNSPLQDLVKVRASAVPAKSGDRGEQLYNREGKPLYVMRLWVDVPGLRSSEIEKVTYFFDHASFSPRRRVGTDASDGFAIAYTGWGCLPNVPVTVVQRDGEQTELDFPFCDAINSQLSLRPSRPDIPRRGSTPPLVPSKIPMKVPSKIPRKVPSKIEPNAAPEIPSKIPVKPPVELR